MKANIGSTDKLIRLLLAIVLILLFYFEILTDTFGIIALISALVLTVTSLINFCPLYTFLKINTTKTKEKSK
jgi:membrane-bound ClpP family serine protease